MISLMIDLDGTLYRGHQSLPGAADFIQSLRGNGIPFLFVTNNSSRTPEQVAAHLNELGISAAAEEVMTSAMATAEYVKRMNRGTRVFVIGEAGLQEAMRREGLTVTDQSPDIVVQGLDRSISYEKYTVAVRAILNGAPFVMTNPDQLLPSEEGFLPGSGSLGAVIRTATGVEPLIIGKPSSILMQAALDRIGAIASQSWAVGDHILTDIAAGYATGMPTILVMTGVAAQGDLEDWYAKTEARADITYPDLSELNRLLQEASVSGNPQQKLSELLMKEKNKQMAGKQG